MLLLNYYNDYGSRKRTVTMNVFDDMIHKES